MQLFVLDSWITILITSCGFLVSSSHQRQTRQQRALGWSRPPWPALLFTATISFASSRNTAWMFQLC